MSHHFRSVYTGLALAALCYSPLRAQTDPPAGCPSYTHKEVVNIGQRASLPNGWYVYAKAENGALYAGVFTGKILPGVYKSGLRDNNPTLIPGTEKDTTETIEISDDGEWIVYLSRGDSKIYLVRVDGSRKVAVTTSAKPIQCGFYRQSPYGSEIWYMHDNHLQLRAVKCTWTNGVPAPGTERVIADLTGTDKIFGQGAGQMSVCKDQIFGRVKSTSRFMTIPDLGKGIAKFEFPAVLGMDPSKDVKPGCGETMSHDGVYCVANPGNAGSGGCVPDPAGGMDHKGFVVTPFVRAGQPVAHRDLYLKQGFSINWCPKEYRFGTSSDIEFHEYYVGNNPEYTICVQRGSKATSIGVWIVQWKTSTWTLLSDKGLVADGPAVYFTDKISTAAAPQVRRAVVTTSAVAGAHDLQGRYVTGDRIQGRRGLLVARNGMDLKVLLNR